MAKKANTLLEQALEVSQATLSTSRSGGGSRTTYLDRFVNVLLDENGNPTERKTRVKITTEIALEIVQEEVAKIQAENEDAPDFTFENEEYMELYKKILVKAKSQVAACVANNKNNTSLTYNPKYKDVWTLNKEGGLIGLVAIETEE